jgi:hypothetical protein
MGNFSKVCFKSVKEVVLTDKEDSLSDEDHYTLSILIEVTKQYADDEEWPAIIQVGPGTKINFKLDSGSDVTAITQEESQKLQP